MRELLEKKFFPSVIKPGRYAGGELGQIVKDPTGRLKYLHCYPDKYELGHSYPGLQILYHLVNQQDHLLCERAFAIDRDAEEVIRREHLTLFSLETGRPARAFDAIGFTLVDETVYTNLLAMIELAGISLHSSERREDDPIIMAGGPAVYNPEPLAPFIDLFFIGDAEDGLLEILSLLHQNREKKRHEKLVMLAQQVESIYVPALYEEHRRPLVEGIPERIKARVARELKAQNYPSQPIVPLIEVVHNHLGIEIMRGCPQGCRFCMAGSIYRPVRIRSQNDVLQQIETQLGNTGYDEVTLLSLSATDYPEIEPLTTTLIRRYESQRVSIGLPSLRPGSISPTLLDAVKRVRKSGLTIAPEAGSERLRLFIRKDFPDAAIFDTARLAFERGWMTIKLYFMLGLPTETDDDLLGIAHICRTISQIGREFPGNKTINVTLSPFIPKAHTPFQWDEVLTEDEVERRIQLVKRSTRAGQVSFKINSPRLAILSALLGRGGRQIADVIETAYRSGCRFEGWGEEFDFQKWMAAFQQHQIDVAGLLRPIPFSAPLPWGHIDKGVTLEHLASERQRTSVQLRDYVPPQFIQSTEQAATQFTEYGRGKKKVPTRNLAAPTKNRFRLRWGKSARYRYMSHLDNLRLLERAIRRSGMPVAYSQGFNPGMKLSFGPPLPLGFTSETEFVDVTLETTMMNYMLDSLKGKLPEGIGIYDARIVLGNTTSLSASLNRVVYTAPLNCWSDVKALEEAITRLQTNTELVIDRPSKGETKRIDIRPAIHELRCNDDTLSMTLGLGDGGYARPNEVAEFLTDGLLYPTGGMPFHRKAMFRVEPDGTKIDAMDL